MSETSTPPTGPAVLIGPKGLKLRTATLMETLGRPFRFELEIVGEGKFLPAREVLGKPMALQINPGGTEQRFVHGLVSEFHFLGSTSPQLHLYRAILRPWVWLLSRVVNCRIFTNATIPDIIKAVFSTYQADFEPVGLDGHRPKEFVVQYNESDLNFVTRLMEEEGLYYYFKHTEGRHTLVLVNHNHSHSEVAAFKSLPYFPPDAQRKEHTPCIDSWEASCRVEANAYATKDFDFEKPTAPLLFTSVLPREDDLDDLEIFDYPGEFREVADGEDRARYRVDEPLVNAESFAGRSNARSIHCGSLTSMTEHPVGDYNTRYLITSTVLRVAGLALGSGDMLSGVSRCDFVALHELTYFRLQRITPKPRIMGAQTAIVVTRPGNEIDADPYGRVRVRFHWDRRNPDEVPFEEMSCPVRVSQLWAGSGFGGIHIPRKGQEVVVEFLEGDPDRPLITGRVYNFDNPVPYELPAHQTQSGIKTSTVDAPSVHFNELRFEDAKGKEEVFIQAERDKTVKVKRNRAASVGASDTLRVEANRTVTVKGNLTVHVGDKPGKYALDAKESIELKCGTSTIKLTPDRIEIEGGEILIKGTTLVDAKAAMIKLNS